MLLSGDESFLANPFILAQNSDRQKYRRSTFARHMCACAHANALIRYLFVTLMKANGDRDRSRVGNENHRKRTVFKRAREFAIDRSRAANGQTEHDVSDHRAK